MTEAEHPRRGTLWGVSLGPGAPGLITRAAWAALQRRDTVWVYPARSGKTPSYALDIVTRAGLVPPADHAGGRGVQGFASKRIRAGASSSTSTLTQPRKG